MTQLLTVGQATVALLGEFIELPTIRKSNFDRYGYALIDMSDSVESETLRQEWCSVVCIDIRLGCNVVDDSGNVLFTVPAMKPPVAELYDKHVGDLLDEVHRRQEVHPNNADGILKEHFTPELYRGAITTEDMKNWQHIVSLYGKGDAEVATAPAIEFNVDVDDDGW